MGLQRKALFVRRTRWVGAGGSLFRAEQKPQVAAAIGKALGLLTHGPRDHHRPRAEAMS